MDNTFTKLYFLAIFTLFTITGAFAQTITVGSVDPGPYAPGSTVAVPISLGTTGSCLDKSSNQFQVILSNSSGSFASGTTVIGTYSGFYAGFVNATIPAGTAVGSYNIEVVSTTPASTSSNTASITVQAGTAVKPTLSSTETVGTDVFGRCVGTTTPYTFMPTSSGTVTASFHNEISGGDEGTDIIIPTTGYQFTPVKANYTIIAKSTNGSVVGTYGYQLINNDLLNPFSPVGQPFACMPTGGKATLTFGYAFTGAIGINNNYPGTLYTVNWGDGTTSVLDYCDIAQAGGKLSHDYTAPTCGSATPLQVISQPSTPYCGGLTAPSTTTAKIIITPTVNFALPAIACVGTAVTVPNNSKPGPDYSTATQTDCNLQNPNALYDWYFDGTKVASSVPLSYSYVIPATTTHGTHTITLHADPPVDPNTPYCGAADVTKSICFENPSQAAFTITSPVCITSMPVSVNNTSTVDSAPCSPAVYTWSVTPSTYSFAGGTDQNSVSPKFTFTAAGTYTVTLNITDAANTSCASSSIQQTIVVQTTPIATLSTDVSLCGDNQTLTFDGTSGSSTKVTFTGAASTDSYAWTVTPPAGGSAVFAGGTSLSSKYPKITFVGYGTYTINVTHTNACGSISDSQNITFIQPPTVSAGTDQTVCAYPVPTVTLSGNVVGGTGYSWSSAGGGTFSSTTSLTPTYTPSASEISAGIATLTLTATSTAPCLTTTDQVVINITPQAKINSSSTVAICSGQALNYNITADHVGTSFTWTASATTGTASGFTTPGSGNNITDLLTTTGTTDAIVTYTIDPTYNSCPGVPFTLQVTVHPLPSATATAPSPVCSNVLGNANITLSSNVSNTSYTWTSSAPAGVTGNSTQNTAILTNNIVDNLVNNNTTPANVTYTITPYNGSCPGTPVTVSITVEPSPITANAGPLQHLCNVTSVTLQANDPTPQTGFWTQVPSPTPGVSFSNVNDPYATVSGLTPGNKYQFQWTITASASCPTSSSSVSIIIDKAPLGGIATANPAEVCQGGNSSISLTGKSGTLVEWQSSIDTTLATNWISTNVTADTLVVANLAQTTYYRALIHDGASCPNVYSTIATVIVDPPPTAASAGPNATVCYSSGSYQLRGNPPTVGTGVWSQVSSAPFASFSSVTDPYATVTPPAPGMYTFRWTISASANCPPSSSTVTITFDPPAVGGIVTANPAEVCVGGNSSIALAGRSGTLVEWQSSTDSTFATNLTSISITADTLNVTNLAQTTYYRALVHNGASCPDVYSTITKVIVDPPPTTANAGLPATICYSDGQYQLSGNPPAVGTGVWSQVSIGPSASFSSNTDPQATVTPSAPGQYTFKWTITASPSCPPSNSTVTITFDAPPVGGMTSSDAHVCLGTNAGRITLSGQSGKILRWEYTVDSSHWFPIADTTNLYDYSGLMQTTQYRAVITNGVCPVATSTPTTITVDQPPIAANAGQDNALCNQTGYVLQGNNPSPGKGKWSVVGNPASIVFADDTLHNSGVSGLQRGTTYKFVWTISNRTGSCPSTADTVTIKNDPPAVGGTTLSDAHVCSGANQGTIQLTGNVGTVLYWEYNDSGTWQTIFNTTNKYDYSGLLKTTKYRAWVQIPGSTCPADSSTITTITVDPPPPVSDPGPSQTICYQPTYTLKGNAVSLPNKGVWTIVSEPSTANAKFVDSTNNSTDITNLIPGKYVFRWTINNATACPPSANDVTIIIDKAPMGGTTSADATVCAGSNGGPILLSGEFGHVVRWEYRDTTSNGWQSILDTNKNISYNNLNHTTKYRAWVQNGVCPEVPSTVTTITVDPPPVAANAGPDDRVCNQTSYTLNADPVALPNKGRWSMLTGPSLPVFADPTNPKTRVDSLKAGKYQFIWTVTNTAACPPQRDEVDITIDPAPYGGITSTNDTVCYGNNSGQIRLSQQIGSIVGWEFSVGGNNWQPIGDTTSVIPYKNLTRTTQYRAIVRNGLTCGDVRSMPDTITVNPPTPIADAGPNQNLCNQYTTTLKGNDPGTFVGTWTQTGGLPVTIVDPNNYTTSVTGMKGGNTYKFTWTIKGLPPCGNESADITIKVSSDIIPSFAMDQDHGCGPVTVTFTNTSTPTPTGGTFVWNFGDGSPQVTAVNPPSHTFQPSNDGTVAIYEVSMTPTSNCGSQAPYVAYVKVSSAKPIAALNPSQTSACGTFTLSAQNLSPGDNAQYDFYLKDANGNVVQHLTYPDTRDAVFQPMTVTQQTHYSMYLVVIDKCGNQATSPSTDIAVSPSSLISKIQIKGDVGSVCIGSPVTFQNISTGGDRFTITIYDSNKKPLLTLPAGTGDIPYLPTATGVYYVSITAGNTGCGDAPESALKQFTVYPIPKPSFTWTADQNFNVTFNNTTPGVDNIPASSLTYKWDFGDGSTFDPSYIPATHHFDFSKAPFTVTLTATTPGTECADAVSQSINITFKGNLFIPNAFIPASSNKNLNTFIAKGFGLKTWRMQIFNNFGQLVWETTKLDSNGGPVDGWDGTYKGRIVEQGVYIWQISATLLNGEDWKGMSYHNSSPSKTGAIHLIR